MGNCTDNFHKAFCETDEGFGSRRSESRVRHVICRRRAIEEGYGGLKDKKWFMVIIGDWYDNEGPDVPVEFSAGVGNKRNGELHKQLVGQCLMVKFYDYEGKIRRAEWVESIGIDMERRRGRDERLKRNTCRRCDADCREEYGWYTSLIECQRQGICVAVEGTFSDMWAWSRHVGLGVSSQLGRPTYMGGGLRSLSIPMQRRRSRAENVLT
ncbi:hypothetical protein V6N13_104925 [Hibiscus sabdariffa]|uniref:Uncharacterized protein n=1 Tax=Hibiscus sabdariffa TaxID=183260 RepID=A0ABR2SID2_9ROSI